MAIDKDFSAQLEAFNNRSLDLDYDPPVVYIETVRGCPHSCVMCDYRRTKLRRLPESLRDKIEPHFKNVEVMAIHGDGEPLLSDIGYYVNQSIENDFVLHMNTSGFLLTKELSDTLSQTRLSIRFSIHAGRKETYYKIMGRDLDKVRKNVAYLVNKAHQKNTDHDLMFSFLVLKENIDEIEDFLRLAHDCGIGKVRFMKLNPNLQTLRGVRMEDRDYTFKYSEQFNEGIKNRFLSSLDQYRELCDKLDIKIEWGSLNSDKLPLQPVREAVNILLTQVIGKGVFPLCQIQGTCLAPWIGQLIVCQTGNVRLCCASPYSVGDLNRSTLPEIWNSAKMKAIRKAFSEGYIPKACGYCKGFSFDNYPENSFRSVQR